MDTAHNNSEFEEATEDQLALLLELGVPDTELDGLDYEEAAEWIAELQAERDAGKLGSA